MCGDSYGLSAGRVDGREQLAFINQQSAISAVLDGKGCGPAGREVWLIADSAYPTAKVTGFALLPSTVSCKVTVPRPASVRGSGPKFTWSTPGYSDWGPANTAGT